MNKSISDFHSSKGTGNKYNGFGPATFPSSKIRSMNFAIHDSSLGKGYPSCDKTYSALLGTKPVEAKSESNLRLTSSVLDTAEHFMAAAGSLLKDKGDEFDDLKSLLLHVVDQSLGVSQLLLLGTCVPYPTLPCLRDKRCWINHPFLSLLRRLCCFPL